MSRIWLNPAVPYNQVIMSSLTSSYVRMPPSISHADETPEWDPGLGPKALSRPRDPGAEVTVAEGAASRPHRVPPPHLSLGCGVTTGTVPAWSIQVPTRADFCYFHENDLYKN